MWWWWKYAQECGDGGVIVGGVGKTMEMQEKWEGEGGKPLEIWWWQWWWWRKRENNRKVVVVGKQQ